MAHKLRHKWKEVFAWIPVETLVHENQEDHMDVSLFSNRYFVRRMTADDIAEIYALCRKNVLYYKYCPPFVTERSIADDMRALPPNKEAFDKYYLGYYDGEKLIAVMDFIMSCPDEKTAFIGFFMTDTSVQNKGVGSGIIRDLCLYLKSCGLTGVRLGWVKGNPQAEHFWHKNGFAEIGVTYDTDMYTVVVAQQLFQNTGTGR